VAGGRVALDGPDGLGSAPTYQWYKDDVAVTGATSTSYPLDPTELSGLSEVTFHYVVKNGIEEFSSNKFVVSVRNSSPSAPVILVNPVPKLIVSGTATLSVSAIDTMTGRTNTLTYKWYRSRDGVNWFTTGDTGSSASVGAGFVYKCLVRGVSGASDSVFSETAFVRLVSTLKGRHVGTLQNAQIDYGTADRPRFPGRVTLDVTSTGFFSGRLDYEGATYSLSGDILAAATGLPLQVVRSRVTPKLQSDVAVNLAFEGIQGGISVSASHEMGALADPVVSSSVLRMTPVTVATTSRGVFSAALSAVAPSIVSMVPGLDQAMPILQVTTGSTGTVSYTGRTVDGVAVSGSGSLVTDSAGRLVVPVFAKMYGVYPYAGQLAGTLLLTPTASPKVSGELEWRKPDLMRWTTTSQKGTYTRGAVAAYQVLPEATAFAAAGFTSSFKPDGVFYSTTVVSSQWDTGTQYRFRTSATVTSANYTGNVFGLRGVTTEGLLGLIYSKVGGTISLNYIRNGRVSYGYGLMFPGGKVYGFMTVNDEIGSASWRAQ
jgi:hypothetical protein